MKLWSRTSVIGLAVALVATTACSRERSGDVRDGPGGSNAIGIVLQDEEFAPEVLRFEAGAEVTVEVRNEGSYGYDFTIDALDLSTGTVEPGQMVTTFTVPDGTTRYRCTLHPGMDGEIVAA